MKRKSTIFILVLVAGFIMACSTTSLFGKKKANPTMAPAAPTAIRTSAPASAPTQPPTATSQSPTNNPPQATAAPTTSTYSEAAEIDDPSLDLYECKSNKPIAKEYARRINPELYVDLRHISMKVVPLEDAHVTMNGQMCAYQITVTYDHPIGDKRSVQGEAEFTSGALRANYRFVLHDKKVTWKPDMRNIDTGATIVPDNVRDFHLQVKDGKLVVTIPCYAVPYFGADATWNLVTYTTRPNGSKQYCDEIRPAPSLPAPTLVWDGQNPIVISDPTHDVIDMTHKVNNIADPLADVSSLTVLLTPPTATLSMKVDQFPPPDPVGQKWSMALRMNLLLMGHRAIVCARNSQKASAPTCKLDVYGLQPQGCLLASGDYYLTDTVKNTTHKDRVGRTLLCYKLH